MAYTTDLYFSCVRHCQLRTLLNIHFSGVRHKGLFGVLVLQIVFKVYQSCKTLFYMHQKCDGAFEYILIYYVASTLQKVITTNKENIKHIQQTFFANRTDLKTSGKGFALRFL